MCLYWEAFVGRPMEINVEGKCLLTPNHLLCVTTGNLLSTIQRTVSGNDVYAKTVFVMCSFLVSGEKEKWKSFGKL